MYIAKHKFILLILIGFYFSLFNIAGAQELSDAAPLSQCEIDQFQAWLKNNKVNKPAAPCVTQKEQVIPAGEAPALITNEGAYEEVPPVISPPMSYNKSQQLT